MPSLFKSTTEPPANLRATTLSIALQNESNVEIEIWLESQKDDQSPIYTSKSVVLTGTHGTFDVDAEMLGGADGFDPEHVVRIGFKNHGSDDVTITSAVASCKKAVDINSCSATYNDALDQWEVLVDVANKDNVASYTIDAKVDGLNEFTIAGVTPVWTDGKAKFVKADNPYLNNQGKSYQFTATILNSTGTTASKECSVSPETIGAMSASCSIVGGVTSVVQGAGLPTFQVQFANCPDAGCSYELYLESYPVLTGTATQADRTVTVTPNGNTNTTSSGEGSTSEVGTVSSYLSEGTYHYYAKNPSNSQFPFKECNVSFEITKAAGPDVGLQTGCSFKNTAAIKPGANVNFVATNGSNVAGKDYKLVYMSGTEEIEVKTGNMGTNTQVSFDINGTATSKSRSFTLKIKDTDDVYKTSCTADLSVKSIGLDCSNNGQFHVDVTNTCENNACPYQVKKTYKGETSNLANASGTNLGNSSYNFTTTGYGTYVLWVNGEATDCSVTFAMNKPGFACPTAPGVTIGQPVTFTLGSVTGCSENENDCSYAIGGTSSYGSGYKSGALNPFTDNAVTETGKKSYTVSLTNESGTTSHDCEVDYNGGNAGTGNATCTVPDSVKVGQPNLTFSVSGMDPAPTTATNIPLVCNDQTVVTPMCQTSGNCGTSNFQAPKTAGTYICDFKLNNADVCSTKPTIVVVAPVSCSVSEDHVSAGTQITFSGEANTSYGAQANSCGIKVNGNWLDNNQNQNVSEKTITPIVNATTTFSFVCTQGSFEQITDAEKAAALTCTKTVTVD